MSLQFSWLFLLLRPTFTEWMPMLAILNLKNYILTERDKYQSCRYLCFILLQWHHLSYKNGNEMAVTENLWIIMNSNNEQLVKSMSMSILIWNPGSDDEKRWWKIDYKFHQNGKTMTKKAETASFDLVTMMARWTKGSRKWRRTRRRERLSA